MYNCLLSRKDTTLKAIHNTESLALIVKVLFAISQRYYIESNSQRDVSMRESPITVCYLAKILHWKQFTTGQRIALFLAHCLLSRKDTTLKAIHNKTYFVEWSQGTVCYLAKILHWKQFTTLRRRERKPSLLFAISQRYYIESNSQPTHGDVSPHMDCLLSRKDTTLKAIHNATTRSPSRPVTVCYLAKILHWKQFTTSPWYRCLTTELFAISQRYYIESNSQHNVPDPAVQATVCYLAKILHWKQFTTTSAAANSKADCLLSRKDTTLKAIHNTTKRIYTSVWLFAISQRYYIESNSQHRIIRINGESNCLLSRKDTTLKAIHNSVGFEVVDGTLFAISQRYYIESNSQPGGDWSIRWLYCLLSRKDTTLKAIHNENSALLSWRILFAISQRYYIESNSQQDLDGVKIMHYCLLSRKDTTLKAIHNPASSALAVWLLFAISQRYYIESNSQRGIWVN